jgi:antitoxin VapB
MPESLKPRKQRCALATPATTAKLFQDGRSQAVRLPAQFRFEGTEVFIRHDPSSGDVILSHRSGSWESFFALTKATPAPKDFLENRGDLPPQARRWVR